MRGIAFSRGIISTRRMRPEFLIIGAQKSGTSSLYKYFGTHDHFLQPLLKDVFFFDKNYHKCLNWYLSYFPAMSTKRSRERRLGGPVVTGEGATYYLFHPWVPQRVRESFPDMKIIVLLRDPVTRAISHYFHNVKFRRETASMIDAFINEQQRIPNKSEYAFQDPSLLDYNHEHYSYLARGIYVNQLKRWYAQFPEEQIMVLCSERFFADPDTTFRRICRFVGIPEVTQSRYFVEGRGNYRAENREGLQLLIEYFQPHNERLFRFLGERYNWMS